MFLLAVGLHIVEAQKRSVGRNGWAAVLCICVLVATMCTTYGDMAYLACVHRSLEEEEDEEDEDEPPRRRKDRAENFDD